MLPSAFIFWYPYIYFQILYWGSQSSNSTHLGFRFFFFLRKHNDFQSFQFCLCHQKFCLPENSCLYMYHLVSIIPDCMSPMHAKGWIWTVAHRARLRRFAMHSPLHLIPEEVVRLEKVPKNWIDEDCNDHVVLCPNKWVFTETIASKYLSRFSVVPNQVWQGLLVYSQGHGNIAILLLLEFSAWGSCLK